jgi:hypothetical protein
MLHPKRRLPRVDVARACISLIKFTACKRNYSEQLQQRQLLMLLATAAPGLRISEIQQSHVSWHDGRTGIRFDFRYVLQLSMSSPSRLLLRTTDRRTRAICNAANLAEHARAAIFGGKLKGTCH